MTKLQWGSLHETKMIYGVDRGMVYPKNQSGIKWNGLLNVIEKETSTASSISYIDGLPVAKSTRAIDYEVTINAYTYPDIIETTSAGFSWRTMKPNSVHQEYQIHILYNATFEASELNYESISNTESPVIFEWTAKSVPDKIDSYKWASHVIVDSNIAYPWLMDELENILYGTELDPPRLPDFSELLDIFERNSILTITDHGDGTWTADGPDEIVSMIGPTEFEIRWPSVIFLDLDTYQVSSL